ncbi:MAG: fibronectin type III domain-containing protein, partial [Defluviitaleaceae bacterium]|nr:fibronectin type III domain-containing protein [Defluviitaleaceae bacterium]
LLVIKNPVSTLNSRPDPMSPIQNARFYYAEIEFMTDAAHINATTDAPDRVPPDQLRWEDSLFYYPNIYFFQVSAVAWGWVDPFTGDLDLSNKLIESIYTSNEVNITLDDISGFTVPPPLNLTVKAPSPMVLPPDEKPSLEVSWEIPYAAIDKYLSTQYELDPDPRYDLITVNLYFGHYEPYIKKNYYENGLSMPDMAEQRINQSFEIEFVPPGAISYELDVSEAPHGGGFIDLRPYLRLPNGPSSVVVITGIPVDVTSVLLTGLDTNQAYYVFADLAIEQYSQTDYVETKTSPLTGVVTERTYASDNVPRPSEVEPPAPNFWLDPDSVDDTECTLYWDKILPESGQVVIEYEMIRLRDTQMTEADFASKDTDFNAFFNRIANAEKVGWRFNNTDVTPLQILNGRAASNYIYDPTDDPIKFTDKTLTPNQLYFYYLRTVRMVTEQDEDGNDVVKKRVSTWNRVTVTTKPVQAATNLRVESGRQDYDRQTEVIVSFRAGLDPDRRGIDYTFQFQVKEDDGDWFTVPGNSVNAVFLESAGIPGSPDYRFFYKLTGLKPGTSYSVRVRVHDLGTNAFSIWSNVAQFKTDMNQEDYDNEVATDDWLHYLRQLFEKLLRDPYWVAFESPSSLTVVYRPGDMFAGILQITADAQILLYNNNADSVTYYIPAENIRRANDAEKGFKAQYSDMDVLMPPKMLNGNYNDAMIAMAKLLNTKEVSDYFVKVTVMRRTIDGLVDGAPALTKQTRVDIDAVGTVPRIGSIKAWDAGLYEQFAKIVGERIKDPALKKSILDRVKAETQSEEMVRYMESLVREMKNDLMRLIYNQMNSIGGILSSRSFAFQNYDLPLRLVSKGIDPNTNINGYQAQSNAWSPVPVTNYAEGKAISTRVPNTFVFAGRAVNIPGIENVPKGGSISAFTAKYGLEDYLGFSGVNLNAAATRQMVAGCVARMAGAPKSADPIAWVSANLNVQLSSRSANGNVQAQEAAAVVMALYAKKTNTSVDRITIRNFAITSGMALDERYAQSVRAAFEVGILSDPGFRPGGNVTIKGLLDMLAALDSKVKL